MGSSGNTGLEVRCDHVGDGDGDGAMVVVARGEPDVATAPVLERVLADADATGAAVVLDLRAVTFIDSSGLSAIVREHHRVTGRGPRFAVAIGSAHQVQRLFSLSGLSATIELVQDAGQLVDR